VLSRECAPVERLLPQRANPTTESEGPTNVTASNFALNEKSLQNRIKKGERVFNSGEVVSPACKRVSDFNRAHGLVWELIDDGSHKVRPCDFSFYLLPERVLDPDFGRFQLGDFHIQSVALLDFQSFLRSYIGKGFLEGVGHAYSREYTRYEHNLQE